VSADPPFAQPSRANKWLTGVIVLLAGLVAIVLNLILSQEDEPLEEHYEVEQSLDNAEAGSINKRGRLDA